MTGQGDPVRERYTRPGLLDRMEAFLRQQGVDPMSLTCQDLFPIDQLHGRGIQATFEHLEHAGITSDMRVLDLGCALGGASRVMATERGCSVTAIDLTPTFVEIARELTRRCGMAGRIEFHVANALELPFDDASFDHGWCHNVTMNIQDKTALATEVARVLRPGGQFSCSEVAKGPGDDVIFPLPWADDASASFLVTPEAMRQTFEEQRLRVVEELDLTGAAIAFAQDARVRAGRGEPPVMVPVAMGDDFAKRLRNGWRCLAEGRTVEHLFLAVKT